MSLINLAKSEFEVVSQWGIGRKGKGAEIFDNLAKGWLIQAPI